MVAAAIVTAIFVARLVAAFLIETPRYFPDEYFYTALSRSLWSGSFPSIRGEHVEFVSLLAPLVFAPAWLVDNVDVAYRIAQTEGALAIALSALPAYILAARIGLGDRSRVAAAVFAVAVPDAVYGGFMLSEPFAYPLFLTGVLLAVETLAAPTARKQVLFLVVCGLLVFTRTQFAVLPIIYLCAGWAFSGHLSPRRVVREQWLVIAIVAIAGGLVATIGMHRSLGIYAGLASFELTPGDTLHWFAANAVLLAIASGWVIVPGAILGILSMIRSRDARQRAFGLLVVPVIGALLLQAAIFGVGVGQLMERYTFYGAPLLALAFLAAMRDGFLERRAHRALLAAFAGLALMLPVDDLLLFARDDFAPVLVALRPARDALGSAFPLAVVAPLIVATVAALIFARYGRPFAVALIGLAICGGASAGASVVLAEPGQGGARPIAISGPATFVASRSTDGSKLMSTLFWNPAIQRVLVDAGHPDNFAATAAEIGRGGVVKHERKEGSWRARFRRRVGCRSTQRGTRAFGSGATRRQQGRQSDGLIPCRRLVQAIWLPRALRAVRRHGAGSGRAAAHETHSSSPNRWSPSEGSPLVRVVLGASSTDYHRRTTNRGLASRNWARGLVVQVCASRADHPR